MSRSCLDNFYRELHLCHRIIRLGKYPHIYWQLNPNIHYRYIFNMILYNYSIQKMRHYNLGNLYLMYISRSCLDNFYRELHLCHRIIRLGKYPHIYWQLNPNIHYRYIVNMILYNYSIQRIHHYIFGNLYLMYIIGMKLHM